MPLFKIGLTKRAIEDARSCHREHGIVASAFSRDERVLYRRDGATLLARADTPPMMTQAFTGIDMVPELSPMRGLMVRGLLRASPTVSEPTPGRRGKVRAILNETDVLMWFDRKLVAAGLGLVGLSVESEAPAMGHRGNAMLTHNRAQARFCAEIVDTSALNTALSNGIGRGKAYGHGLLIILPE